MAQQLLAAAMKPISHKTPSAGLHSTLLGDSGPYVAFLHGLFGQGRNWTGIAKSLRDQYRVILVDLPNHGESAWTDHVSYPEMAIAVGDLLTSTSDDRPVTVVGHSMGGKVAMALALLRPRLVSRLCVVDIAPVRYPASGTFADFVKGMRALDLDRVSDRASADGGLAPYIPDSTIRGFLLQNLRSQPDSGRRGWRWRMNLELLGDHLVELGDWPELRAPPYQAPVLWVAGAKSDYITEDSAQVMRGLFPKVQLIRIKRAGHWVHSEQPEVFTDIISAFLAGE